MNLCRLLDSLLFQIQFDDFLAFIRVYLKPLLVFERLLYTAIHSILHLMTNLRRIFQEVGAGNEDLYTLPQRPGQRYRTEDSLDTIEPEYNKNLIVNVQLWKSFTNRKKYNDLIIQYNDIHQSILYKIMEK